MLRIGRAPGNPGRGERPGVQPERLAVGREELRRTVAGGGIELGAQRQVGKRVVGPARAGDPRRVRPGLGPGRDPLLDFLERRRAEELDAVARETAGHERGVGVVETGEDGRALRVDDGRLRTAIAHDLALAADLENLVAADRDRVGDRAEIVGGIHPGVVDDQIDRTAVVGALGADDEPGDERAGHDRDDEVSGKTRGHGGRPDSITPRAKVPLRWPLQSPNPARPPTRGWSGRSAWVRPSSSSSGA